MLGMFQETKAFDQPLEGWNTASVTDMSYMFLGATAFNHPVAKWDVGKVTGEYDMQMMFADATAFNQPLGPGGKPVVRD